MSGNTTTMQTVQRRSVDHKLKHVFVCGLQRSGTSVLARNIGRFPESTAFKDTGAIEDEGQYLQDLYPVNNVLGGTGWYGFDPTAHLTEKSELLTPENVERLHASWSRYWDPSKNIRIEKTPGNLIMTRFLQAAFPGCYFIVIRRHPVAVSMANQRWKKSMASLHVGFEHWLHCYALFEEDKKFLNNVYELTYEQYIADPGRYHREIANFIGATLGDETLEEVTGSHNRRYFERWRQLRTESPFRSYYQYVAGKYEPRFVPFGYSLLAPEGGTGASSPAPGDVAEWRGKLCCAGADLHAWLWRLAERGTGQLRRAVRTTVPQPIRQRLKAAIETDAPARTRAS